MPRIIRRITEHITITTWTLTADEVPPLPPASTQPAHPSRAFASDKPECAGDEAQATGQKPEATAGAQSPTSESLVS